MRSRFHSRRCRPRECRLRGAVGVTVSAVGLEGTALGGGARGQRQRGADAEVCSRSRRGRIRASACARGRCRYGPAVTVGLCRWWPSRVFCQPGKGPAGVVRAVDVVALKGRSDDGIPREGDLRVGRWRRADGAAGSTACRRRAGSPISRSAPGVGAGLIANTPELELCETRVAKPTVSPMPRWCMKRLGRPPQKQVRPTNRRWRCGQRRAAAKRYWRPSRRKLAEEAGEDRAAGRSPKIGGGADRAGAIIVAAAVAISNEIIFAACISTQNHWRWGPHRPSARRR
jgi:hypothetical protein